VNELTAKQSAFCQEYLIDKNGGRAAVRAGYSVRTAESIACEMLTKPYIQAEISHLTGLQIKRNQATVDLVIGGLAEIATFDISTVCEDGRDMIRLKPMEKWPEGAGKMLRISGSDKDGTLKVQSPDRTAALTKLGDYLGLFTDFNIAVGALAKYGIVLVQEPGGKWSVKAEETNGETNND
jgi:phage terminase small subunit